MFILILLAIGFAIFLSLFNHDWQNDYPRSRYGSGYYPPPPPPPPMYYHQPPPYAHGGYGGYGGYSGYGGNGNNFPAIIAIVALMAFGVWFYGNKAEAEPPRPQKASYKTYRDKKEAQQPRYQQQDAPCPCKCDCANEI